MRSSRILVHGPRLASRLVCQRRRVRCERSIVAPSSSPSRPLTRRLRRWPTASLDRASPWRERPPPTNDALLTTHSPYKDDGDKTYTYVTYRLHEPITAGKSVGHWISICENVCNYQHVHTVATTSTTTKTYTDEQKTSITSSLESKIEFEGIGSLTGTITTESARTIGKQMSDSFQRGETYSDADNYVFTPEQMRDLKVFAIWQWIADTYLSNGEVATMRSRSFTCTPDANPPQYLPGSPAALKACRGG